MKKFIIFLALIVLIGSIYYFINLSLYEPAKTFFNFPVPKSAKMIKETKHSRIYKWSKASEENGIPFGYKLVLQKNGWESGEKEGALTHYQKDNLRIDLISTTNQISITRVK